MIFNHNKWMNYAILLAKRSKGITGKNPPVGCVIVKNDILLSSGRTSSSGRPHAEENAINSVKDKNDLYGSTMYVTLEPCAHKNLTGMSCAKLIVESGISEIYVSCFDPDPRTAGKGIKILEKNKIKVYQNYLQDDCLDIYDGFFSRILNKKPFVSLKIACSLDGKIALNNNESKWITNDLSRNYSHFIRSQNDAIMTTSSTIIADNPEMNCRLPGLQNRNPTKVILDRYLKVTHDYKIYNSSPNTDILTYSLSETTKNFPKNKKIKNIKIEKGLSNINFFNNIFNDLAMRGINTLLIEAGSKINTILLSLGLIDKLLIFRSGKIIGNDGLPMIDNLNIHSMYNVENYKLSYLRTFYDDVLEIRKLNK
ncbi:bifunctional diaminohydroxyphosphoribosylaminopyrimidine deaminase/5-amino-6-(5-phosphoribosylamino)uracil reductase RibD [Alphaproteobacteria bacterium]|nr:bifunctional diaminohydroxyphosphoribosylaminopyrimidine deaminase/5-amino-6-(5-phosphoribosylamino)uracil reductase RibD [Alphaproteobacteria bacterium]